MDTGQKITLYTQTGITVVVIAVWVYMIVTGQQTPALFDTVVGLITGAYFSRNGSKLVTPITNALSRKDK